MSKIQAGWTPGTLRFMPTIQRKPVAQSKPRLTSRVTISSPPVPATTTTNPSVSNPTTSSSSATALTTAVTATINSTTSNVTANLSVSNQQQTNTTTFSTSVSTHNNTSPTQALASSIDNRLSIATNSTTSPPKQNTFSEDVNDFKSVLNVQRNQRGFDKVSIYFIIYYFGILYFL